MFAEESTTSFAERIIALLRDGDEYRAASLVADEITGNDPDATIRIDTLTEIEDKIAEDLGRGRAAEFVDVAIDIAVRRKNAFGRALPVKPGIFAGWLSALGCYALLVAVITGILTATVWLASKMFTL